MAVLALFAAAAALSAVPLVAQSEMQTCERAVAVLLANPGRLEIRDEVRAQGFGDRTISWRYADGATGICRVDGSGRVYGVEVERFGTLPGGDWPAYTLTCESTSGRRRECSIRQPASVELERQLSRGACREGENWGTYSGWIWVDDGCRAVFRVAPPRVAAPGFGEEVAARVARSACEGKAAQQGLQVLAVDGARRIAAQRLWTVDMRVALRSVRFDARCTYQERTGHVEISGK